MIRLWKHCKFWTLNWLLLKIANPLALKYWRWHEANYKDDLRFHRPKYTSSVSYLAGERIVKREYAGSIYEWPPLKVLNKLRSAEGRAHLDIRAYYSINDLLPYVGKEWLKGVKD